MFIRFVTGETDCDSHVAAGLFQTAFDLDWAQNLPEYEFEAITELRDWFHAYLMSPFDFLPSHVRYYRAICWFKSTAMEHLAHARELIDILERNDVLIWTIQSRRTGYVYYEDEAQVFAEPFYDLRRIVR